MRVGVYLRDFAEFNEIYQQYLTGPDRPVRTTLSAPFEDFDIEIDAVLYTGPYPAARIAARVVGAARFRSTNVDPSHTPGQLLLANTCGFNRGS